MSELIFNFAFIHVDKVCLSDFHKLLSFFFRLKNKQTKNYFTLNVVFDSDIGLVATCSRKVPLNVLDCKRSIFPTSFFRYRLHSRLHNYLITNIISIEELKYFYLINSTLLSGLESGLYWEILRAKISLTLSQFLSICRVFINVFFVLNCSWVALFLLIKLNSHRRISFAYSMLLSCGLWLQVVMTCKFRYFFLLCRRAKVRTVILHET